MTFGSAFKKSNELKMKEFSQEKEQLQELSSLRNLDFSKFIKLDKPKNLEESMIDSTVEQIDFSKLPFVTGPHPNDKEML
jgi:hypothetical protein